MKCCCYGRRCTPSCAHSHRRSLFFFRAKRLRSHSVEPVIFGEMCGCCFWDPFVMIRRLCGLWRMDFIVQMPTDTVMTRNDHPIFDPFLSTLSWYNFYTTYLARSELHTPFRGYGPLTIYHVLSTSYLLTDWLTDYPWTDCTNSSTSNCAVRRTYSTAWRGNEYIRTYTKYVVLTVLTWGIVLRVVNHIILDWLSVPWPVSSVHVYVHVRIYLITY